jgi:hypothetical protein
MTLLDYLKAALAKNEASHGPDDFVSKQLRAQLDSLQGSRCSQLTEVSLEAEALRDLKA